MSVQHAISDTVKKVYFISGLGADKRVFKKLIFPTGFELIYLDWITAHPGESLKDYAARLASKIDNSSPFYLIGVSFGGFLAIEIAKELSPKHTFIISSVVTTNEIPWYYKLAGILKLQRLIPISILKRANKISYKLFGVKTHEERSMLKHILIDTDPDFLKWALTSILSWKNKLKPMNLTHIHGSADKILPVKYVSPNHIIDKGGHLMIYSNASEITKIIMAKL